MAQNVDETTEEMSERIKKNEKALKALEDVPSILGELVKKKLESSRA